MMFTLPYKIMVVFGMVITLYGVGVWHGASRANERYEKAKFTIETQLKAQSQTHLEYVKTLEEQLMEANEHANIIPSKPCLNVDGVRILNSIH